MACIVCGIRPAVDGTVCTDCSAVLQAAVTGSAIRRPGGTFVSFPGAATADSKSPTEAMSTPVSGPSHPPEIEEPGRRYHVGDVLAERYTIVEEIGAGGMGVVYKALDRQLEKAVALKLMRPRASDATSVARFRRELALARGVSHTNVCRVHDMGDVDGVLFISMEHVEGQRLDHLIVSMGHLSARQTVGLARQLCAGLRAIHEQGIVHRDLKPSNIMVNRSGHVFIMDFGLAVRPGADKVTSTGAVLGTFAYLSPEQARGLDMGPRSDIYSLGLVLYEMLTGVAPPGDSVALPLALRDAKERCPRPSAFAPEVPPELDAIVMRCLERDPGKRFVSAAELEEALAALQADPTMLSGRVPARGWPTLELMTPRRMPHWLLAVLGAVLVLAAAIGIRFWMRPPPQAEPPPVVAVLPFSNLSADPAHAHIGVGLADVLITRLASAPRLTVVSAEATKVQTAADMRAVARDLGVSHIVSGTIQAASGRVRVALTLLRARDSVVMSVGEDEAPLSQIFELQSRLAEKVTSALDISLSRDDRTRLARPVTVSLEAFALYSEAKALLQRSAEAGGTEKSIQLLEQATRLDPKFTLAHAALGEAYLARFRETKETAWPVRATSPILTALSLDPAQPAALLSLAMAQHALGDYDQALEHLDRVLARQPRNDTAYQWMGRVLASKRDIDGARRALEKAMELRPGYWEHPYVLADVLREAGRSDEALAAAKQALELRPNSERTYNLLGAIHHSRKETDLALENYQTSMAILPTAAVASNIGTVQYEHGNYGAAAKAYQQAIALTPDDPRCHMNLARAEERLASGRPRRSYGQALVLLDALLSLKPDDARYLGLDAICEMKLARTDRALARVENALERAPRDPNVLYRASVVYAASKRTEEALAVLDRAFEAGLSVSRVERGDGLEAVRDLPRFKALLEKARERRTHASRSGS